MNVFCDVFCRLILLSLRLRFFFGDLKTHIVEIPALPDEKIGTAAAALVDLFPITGVGDGYIVALNADLSFVSRMSILLMDSLATLAYWTPSMASVMVPSLASKTKMSVTYSLSDLREC